MGWGWQIVASPSKIVIRGDSLDRWPFLFQPSADLRPKPETQKRVAPKRIGQKSFSCKALALSFSKIC